jgi:hypothetical protein
VSRRLRALAAAIFIALHLAIFAPKTGAESRTTSETLLLPVSALVYGLRAPNLVLVAACLLTGVALSGYGEFPDLTAQFVLPQLARNALLLVYLALVLAPLLGHSRAAARLPRAAAAV